MNRTQEAAIFEPPSSISGTSRQKFPTRTTSPHIRAYSEDARNAERLRLPLYNAEYSARERFGLRTQEVGGSNPPSSTTKRLQDRAFRLTPPAPAARLSLPSQLQVNLGSGARREEFLMAQAKSSARTQVELGIYRQANGKYAVCARRRGVPRFRTAGYDLAAARRAREELIAALEASRVPASPRLRLDTVAAHWSKRFEAMVAAGERHLRTYEAHRFHLDHDLLPRLGDRRISSLGVEDIAELIIELRPAGRSAKTTANALATLQSVLRFARRRGWILADPVELLEPEERPTHRPELVGPRHLISCEVQVSNVCSTFAPKRTARSSASRFSI